MLTTLGTYIKYNGSGDLPDCSTTDMGTYLIGTNCNSLDSTEAIPYKLITLNSLLTNPISPQIRCTKETIFQQMPTEPSLL